MAEVRGPFFASFVSWADYSPWVALSYRKIDGNGSATVSVTTYTTAGTYLDVLGDTAGPIARALVRTRAEVHDKEAPLVGGSFRRPSSMVWTKVSMPTQAGSGRTTI